MGNMASSTREPAASIVPHTKIQGVDTCGDENGFVYIIRSDLHCYMKCSSNLNAFPGQTGFNQKYEIYPLHPACSGGDHYLNVPWPTMGFFMIIKGDHYIVVDNLYAPSGGFKKQALSDYCKGGDYYFYDNAASKYYIIKDSTFTVVSDLSSDKGTTGTLASSYAEGLYFYGTKDTTNGSIGLITQNDIGVLFTRTNDLSRAGWYSMMFPTVVDFLPGGLAVNYGAATHKWVVLKSFTNSSKKSPMPWSEKVTKTVGFNSSLFRSVERSWQVDEGMNMGAKFEASQLVRTALVSQLRLPASCGGVGKQTEQEDWREAHTTTEEITATIHPGQSLYIWQFRIGLAGSGDVLFCRDLHLTNSPSTPTNIPPL